MQNRTKNIHILLKWDYLAGNQIKQQYIQTQSKPKQSQFLQKIEYIIK